MSSLPKTLRAKLESAVIEARRRAEAAAKDELLRIGVGATVAPSYLSAVERELRRRLRAHGRQLGDIKAQDDSQGIERLAVEVAYEHWHRMLFARFLAENELLIHPDYKVPLSLAECEELAREEEKAGKGKISSWELAAGFASTMLPQIFRLDSPCLSMALAPNARGELEKLLAELPRELFLADDSLGWVYQFWQSEAKDKVNASEKKIGADELPAVTQLFTEDYMVSFLLDNSLGAWWAGKKLSETDLAEAPDEESLRAKLALPGLPFAYLRFAREEGKSWRPASGCFEAWPKKAAELKYLDPCCGSGHFLVAGLRYLRAMRMAEEGLDLQAASDAVIRDNLHGLELDPRCVEIAAFSVAFEAWRKGGGYRELPSMHIACSGLAPRTSKDEWLQVVEKAALGGSNEEAQLRSGMEELYNLFQDAPTLGSLIDPNKVTSTLFAAGYDRTSELLAEALKKERGLDEEYEAGVAAQGIAKAASLLAGRYHLVATNVPYLHRKNHDELLRVFCEKNYPEAKEELATAFFERCLQLCKNTGSVYIVLPQNWLFLTRYHKLREKLLMTTRWNILARLGSGAFETISGEVVNVILLGIQWKNTVRNMCKSESSLFAAVNASVLPSTGQKSELLRKASILLLCQKDQLNNPDARVVFSCANECTILAAFSFSMRGIVSGDNDKWERYYWEIFAYDDKWCFLHTTPISTNFYDGNSLIIDWGKHGKGMLRPGIENNAYGEKGIALGQMGVLPATLYQGSLYDNNTGVIIPSNSGHLAAIWCFCSSLQYNIEVRKIDQSLKVTNATLVQIPFDLDYWTKVAAEKYPHGLPSPFSDNPTQWIFHGHPASSVVWDEDSKQLTKGALRRDGTVLQVALARLLGYRWPAELDREMELSAQSREIVASCEALLPFADEDGIVCIPSMNGERNAEDRLLELLAASYGPEWSSVLLDELLFACGAEGKKLEYWLRDLFFEQHCKLFQHRPFIWQIWDGQRDGFSALVNYHSLTKGKLEKLIYTYLGAWISQQERGASASAKGAAVRLAAAQELKKKLELILEGEAPYDIFVRWKKLEEQSVGWDPDINDGVRLNIRPFMTAGVLRQNKPPKLNVKWEKDRGKDVESSPWYSVFKGERINEYHLSLEEKRRARGKNGA